MKLKWLRTPAMKRRISQLAYPLVAGVRATLRFKSNNHGQRTDPWDPTLQERYIYALWHESFFGLAALAVCAPAYCLVSQSKDGEMLANLIEKFGLGVIRGSSNRGGSEAAQEVLDQTAHAHLLIAPDGPTGPRREVKRGVSYLASWSGKAIIPLGIGFTRAIRLKTWDRTLVPMPFSTVTLVSGPILHVPPSVTKKQSEEFRLELEKRMNAAQAEACAWAGQKDEPPVVQDVETATRRAA